MKENDVKNEGIFSKVKGFGSGMKELLGIDAVGNEYDENDTGILDFSTVDDVAEEKSFDDKKNLGKVNKKSAVKEIFSDEEDLNLLNNCQTVFVDPKSFEEAKKIANYILKDKMITINLESLETFVAQRLMDFLAGAMKIKEASFVPISKKVYTIVPKSMKVYYEGKKNRKKSILEIERED